MPNIEKWSIIYTVQGTTVQTWDGYHSRSEALAAIRDADLLIPLHWEWSIRQV